MNVAPYAKTTPGIAGGGTMKVLPAMPGVVLDNQYAA